MEIEKAVMRQHKFFASGRTKDYAFRRIALLKLQAGIRKYEKDLIKALQKDLHKSKSEAYMAEIGLTLSELTYNLRHLARWMYPKYVHSSLLHFPAKSYVMPEPYGVTLIMAPWNYPVLLCLEPLISAIAAGNCVVLKPSAYAPTVSKVLKKMLTELYPEKYVLVIEGGREENQKLLDCRFDKIFFTGGAAVGKEVLQKAVKHITPVTLELGGKSPCIVDKTANIRLAAKRVAFGKILNSGQTCVAPDYLLLHENIKEPFLQCLEQEFIRMLGNEPLQNPDYPRIVNEKHYHRIMKLIQAENIRFGGYGNREDLQIAPTVLEDVTLDSLVMQEEIFGPILPVLTFQRREDVLGIIEHYEKPLACYLFTKDAKFKRWALKNISFGGGCINDTIMHIASSELGFGGVGASGMGSYHGKKGFECFSHEKSIVERGTWIDVPVRYQPYAKWKSFWIRKFLK
ncbi:MAG: aldehyde dehydrogenase [Lachnospiraceae bacterium]|nr:aldehyde dehydrogenase [Lachnospiraceae bacterium]